MKEERNALQREVFPKLRKLCMEHGFRFQAIDLRWGVSEEAGLDQQTMKICLEEIERSQRVSPKPNFIVLLGDRYGWMPLPYEIPADEFEEIKKVVSPSDKDFLFWEGDVLEDYQLKKREGWYCRDENAVPPVYCLKPRLVGYDDNASDDEIKEAGDLEYNDWEDVEKRLKSILLNAIDELGWEENDPRRFKYESSATEQEIIKGVLNLPEDDSLSEEHVFSFIRKIKGKKSIPFDDYSKDFFDFTAAGTIDVSAEEKLISLKAKIEKKISKSNRFDYETEWEEKGVSKQHIKKLCEDVYSSLEKVINEQINEFEDKDPLDMEIEAHKEFGEERCRFFKGREDSLTRIKNYLDNPNSKPLIVYGESGSGKSALMAQAVEDSHHDFYKVPVDNVIVRFIGATPESSDIRSLLESLCNQIYDTFDFDLEKQRKLSEILGEVEEQNINNEFSIPYELKDLSESFKRFLGMISNDRNLVIFLDALDQLSDYDNAHNLTWIPNELPENVHIVISTLKNIFQSSLEKRISFENTVELLPLEKNEGKYILDAWFIDFNRKLTTKQETEVISKFEVEGLPLYLKLAYEESKLWKSYTPLPELESDIKWMINSLFERLSRPENHGEILVSRSLGYLSAAKNGLTEDEMLDILALDDDVFNLTRTFHEPTEDKLPVALWSRLYFDLEPYLTERSADNTSLIDFYHKQLGEFVKEQYLREVKPIRHKLLVEYFHKQDFSFRKNGKRVYNTRKVSELPYHEVHGECWENLEKTLCDLKFIEAKCSVGMTNDLISDYNLALQKYPDSHINTEKLEREKILIKYVEDLFDYSEGNTHVLDIIPSFEPWAEESIFNEKKRILTNPNPIDRISSFFQFLNSEISLLYEYGATEGFLIQEAVNYAKDGPIKNSLNDLGNDNLNEMILKHPNQRTHYNPFPEIIKTIKHSEFDSPIQRLSVTFDESIVACGSWWENNIEIWDLNTGESLKKLKGHENGINSILITPDGEKLISGSVDKSVRVWDITSGNCIRILNGHLDEVSCVSMTPDSRLAVSGSHDKSIKLWDLKTGNCIKTLNGHKKQVSAISMTPNGKLAVSGSFDQTLRLWNLETGKSLKTFKGHKKLVGQVFISPDGKLAFSSSHDKTLKIWDLTKSNFLGFGKSNCIKTIDLSPDMVSNFSVTPDSKKMVFVCDKTLTLYDLEKDKFLKTLNHEYRVDSVKLSPDSKIAFFGTLDHALNFWDLEKGQDDEILHKHDKGVTELCISFDGNYILSGSLDKTLKLWSVRRAKCLKTLEGHTDEILCISMTPDARLAVSGSYDSSVKLWDLKSGVCIRTLNQHSGGIFGVHMTPDGKQAVSGGWDKKIRVWDLETGNCLKTLVGHDDLVRDVIIAPDGKKVISIAPNMNNFAVMKIWDLETGECVKTLGKPTFGADIGIQYSIYHISMTTDGKKIFTTNSDGSIRLLDFESLELIKKVEGYNYPTDISVTPDGEKGIFISNDGTLNVWKFVKDQPDGFFRSKHPISTISDISNCNKFAIGSSNGEVLFFELSNYFNDSCYK